MNGQINVKCPICGRYVFKEEFDLCPVCEWQQDSVQEDDYTLAGGANKLSVDQYRALWRPGMKPKSNPSKDSNEETAKKKLQDFVERGGSWLEIAKRVGVL